jgi:hypothetical protein
MKGSVQTEPAQSYAVWLLFVVSIVVFAIIATVWAAKSETENNAQAIELAILSQNVSRLEFSEMINAHNITQIAQNVSLYETVLTILQGRLSLIEARIFIIQTATSILFQNITTIYTNITAIYADILIQEINYILLASRLVNTTAYFGQTNNSINSVSTDGIHLINSIPPIVSNIDLNGTCGTGVNVGVLPGTVLIDVCTLNAYVTNLTNTLVVTATELFASVNMSNTTLNTLNGQSPLSGNVYIVAGDGIAVTPGSVSNAIEVTSTRITFINGVAPIDNNMVLSAGANIEITTPGANTVQVGLLYPLYPYVRGINATLGLVQVNGTSLDPYTFYINTNLSEYGAVNGPVSTVCKYVARFNTPAVTLFSIVPGGIASPASYQNLLFCGSGQPGTVVKNCAYNVQPGPGNGACFKLIDAPYGVFKLDFMVTVNAYFTNNPAQFETGSLIELQYCLYGGIGASCDLTSPNWLRAEQPVTINLGGPSVFSNFTVSTSVIVATENFTMGYILARLFCRMGPDNTGFPFTTAPCWLGVGLTYPTIYPTLIVTRIA